MRDGRSGTPAVRAWLIVALLSIPALALIVTAYRAGQDQGPAPSPNAPAAATRRVPATPAPFSGALPTPVRQAPATPQDGNCPPDYPVKGNTTPQGEQLYRTRANAGYDETIPDICFASLDDALAAGYKPAAR
jgi:hypothetical protein